MATPYCLICHNIYIQTEEIAATPCGHVYHNECLTDWLKTSKTCPQCRNPCIDHQIKRIYIDFACDEELAIAQTLKEVKKPVCSDTDTEEMIKMLLEHIDHSSDEQQQKQKQQQCQQQSQNDECDLCIAFQEAYDKILIEKDQLAQVLNSIESENHKLSQSNTETSKIVEELEMQIRANEFNMRHIQEQLETSQKIIAAIQSENSTNKHTIDELKLTISKNAIELNDMHDEIGKLNQQMEKMTSHYASEFQQLCHGIQYIFNGNQQQKFLKRYCDSLIQKCQQMNDSSTNQKNANANANANECQAIVPYCGSIDSWDYIMVPVIKKAL